MLGSVRGPVRGRQAGRGPGDRGLLTIPGCVSGQKDELSSVSSFFLLQPGGARGYSGLCLHSGRNHSWQA